jgi:hypothetical protein
MSGGGRIANARSTGTRIPTSAAMSSASRTSVPTWTGRRMAHRRRHLRPRRHRRRMPQPLEIARPDGELDHHPPNRIPAHDIAGFNDRVSTRTLDVSRTQPVAMPFHC